MKTITHKWKNRHEHILHSLSHGDVLRNELFYHTPGLKKYINQCNSVLSSNNIDLTSDIWIKELVLNKINLYIRDTKLAGPGTVFMVVELEAIYVEMLDSSGIEWSTHVLQFAKPLLLRVSGLLKGLLSNKLSMFFDSVVQNNTQNLQKFFESLVNIVGPARQSMRLKCQSTDTTFNFDKASQISANQALYTS